MLLVFQICFFAGLALIAISFVLGEFFDFLGFDGLDLGFVDLTLIVPLSPTLFILLATIFGGCGLALTELTKKLHIAIIVVISLSIAIIITLLVNRFVVIPLKRAENTSAVPQEELVGALATVTEKIAANGFGQITYIIEGNTYTSPAKSVDKEELPAGTQVSICWIEEHVFYVAHIKMDE